MSIKRALSTIPYFVMLCAIPTVALAVPVDLSTWTAESYASVSGFPPGSWVVGGGGSYVDQVNNGQPTIFYSDFSALNSDVRGKIQVRTANDDDFIGFVLGFNPGDTTNASADYILTDWKQGTQFFNFLGNAATNATPGTTALLGLAASRVTGTPSADEMWGHVNFAQNPGGGVNELARGSTLGNVGWADFVEYEFRFIYTPTNLQVFVNGIQQININGAFPDGRLGFYNFSQDTVRYSAFTVQSVPEPSTFLLLGTGFVGIVAYARRRRR
jgi:hypothetical protein